MELHRKKSSFWKIYFDCRNQYTGCARGNNLLLLSNLSEVSEGYKQASEMLYTPSLPVQIICLGIVIPIMEELIFRGLLFKCLREVMPMVPAVIYSALFSDCIMEFGTDYLRNNMRSSFGVCL